MVDSSASEKAAVFPEPLGAYDTSEIRSDPIEIRLDHERLPGSPRRFGRDERQGGRLDLRRLHEATVVDAIHQLLGEVKVREPVHNETLWVNERCLMVSESTMCSLAS